MNSKSYMLEDVGGIVVRKHHQAHRISIKLRPGQPPAVVVPRFATFDMGYRFALENREWIASHLQQMDSALKSNVYSEERPFSTRYHTVRFSRCQTRCVQAVKADGAGSAANSYVSDRIAAARSQNLSARQSGKIGSRTRIRLQPTDCQECAHALGQLLGAKQHQSEHLPDDAA